MASDLNWMYFLRRLGNPCVNVGISARWLTEEATKLPTGEIERALSRIFRFHVIDQGPALIMDPIRSERSERPLFPRLPSVTLGQL